MRRAVVLELGGTLLVGACSGEADDAAETSAASTDDGAGEPILILTRVTIADEEGAETIATGEVLEGSTIGGSPFCVGGTILDTHPIPDPAEEPYLIERTITCADGTVGIGLTPDVDVPPGPAPDGLVDDRQRHRCLRWAPRERWIGGRVRPRRRLAGSRDAHGDRHALGALPHTVALDDAASAMSTSIRRA